jgi:hypothetical protein
MIISSFNIRGLEGRVKSRLIKEMVSKEKVDFLALQETKLEVVTEAICFNLWGGEDCSWAFLPSVGNSGGIISIWRKSSSTLIFTFMGEGFVGVCLEWGVHKELCYVVNVYSKCDLNGKRRLWEVLRMSRGGFGWGKWCVIGDFNAILHREERRGLNEVGSISFSSEMVEFQTFVDDMELDDLPGLGRKFTWFHPNGRSMSRIDRALVSSDWRLCWGNPSLWILPRTLSDHCPIVLRYNNVDWGPRPFRFNNHWLNHKDFKGIVENCWRSQEVTGWMGFILKEKLKGLKVKIKEWSKEVYGDIDSKITILIEDIKDDDVRGELVGLSEAEVYARKQKFSTLWHLLKSKESMIVQRARSRWLKEGDANTRYFHNCVKQRSYGNTIRALLVDGGWVDSPLLV